jgi:hypothetical protein
LGAGKRLFAEGTIPAAFKVTESAVTSKDVIIVNYEGAAPSLSRFLRQGGEFDFPSTFLFPEIARYYFVVMALQFWRGLTIEVCLGA